MAKLTRKTLLQFGSTANPASEIGQYGSYASPIYSNDVAILQAGTAWPRGWAGETVATNRPFLEDMNAVDFVFGYMLSYILQMGVAEWDSGTTYYINSIVQYAGSLYISLTDTNLNNQPDTSTSNWSNSIAGDPAGTVKMYAGASIPGGYLLCDGSSVSRTTYANLYSAIGTLYGSVDGSHFTLPDCRGLVPVCRKASDANFGNLGQTGGEVTHTLTLGEMPSHSHTSPLYSPNNGGLSGVPQNTPGGADSTSNASNPSGGGLAHNNLQPYITFNFIIKY